MPRVAWHRLAGSDNEKDRNTVGAQELGGTRVLHLCGESWGSVGTRRQMAYFPFYGTGSSS